MHFTHYFLLILYQFVYFDEYSFYFSLVFLLFCAFLCFFLFLSIALQYNFVFLRTCIVLTVF